MAFNKIESGQWKGTYSYVRFGRGEEKIVIFPPLNDAVVTAAAFAWYYSHVYGALGKSYEIYVVSARRKVPVGYSTRDMAKDYAECLAPLGPVTILGISLGGMVAQYFALDYPHLVKRLILVASAYRMGPEGLQIARRWIPWARHGMWKEIYEDTIELSYRRIHRLLFTLLKPFFTHYLVKTVKDPSEFIIAGQAGMLHDTWDYLPKLEMPVLLIAGTKDRFFPEILFYEMSERLPHCEVLIVKDAGHGVFEEHKRTCLKAVIEFVHKKATV